jgi:hypothetical protein
VKVYASDGTLFKTFTVLPKPPNTKPPGAMTINEDDLRLRNG